MIRRFLFRLDLTRLALLLPAAVICSGCSLNKPYPDKNLYAITIPPPPQATSPRGKAVLRVETLRIVRPFDSTTFIYKVGPSRYCNDYYSGFIAPPDRILGGELTDWLSNSGIFATVIDGPSAADYQLSLESNVTEFYGDYSTDKPAAVIEIRFFLLDQRDAHYRIVFEKTYRETEPLAGNTPQQLVDGWGAAYSRILTSLAQDMRQSPVADLANLETR